MGRLYLKRFALAASLAALSLTVSASPAGAATIGQLAPGSPPSGICGFQDIDTVQPTVTGGNSYVVPPYGARITSWSTNASESGGMAQLYTLKVFRKVGPATYVVVAHDGPRTLIEAALNEFPVDIAVQPGDIIGLHWHVASFSSSACEFIPTIPDDYVERSGDLGDESSGDFIPHGGPYRLNVSAVVKPSSAFTLGKAKDNKRRGTATIAATVPGPGVLLVSGKGVKSATATASAITATGPGTVKLAIKPVGKSKKRLGSTGKAKVNPTINYTPTGGDPSSQSIKVKLKKRL